MICRSRWLHLNHWSLANAESGHCYITTGVTAPGAWHPAADQVYVGITAVYLVLSMVGAIVAPLGLRGPLLAISGLQFPLHLYMMLALRLANQGRLEGEESENGWDFGQTTAVILLHYALVDLVRRLRELRRFERRIEAHGAAHVMHEEGLRNGSLMLYGSALSPAVSGGGVGGGGGGGGGGGLGVAGGGKEGPAAASLSERLLQKTDWNEAYGPHSQPYTQHDQAHRPHYSRAYSPNNHAYSPPIQPYSPPTQPYSPPTQPMLTTAAAEEEGVELIRRPTDKHRMSNFS
ncbi:hypothetical protein GGR56DRAFT_168345 [Xylariaceae sp. FL0804]|nr:hypothetical protein GGR56DRAFT_168345 [Xylariaceae sp. FL0804]